jgi:hypothetical protein
LKKKHLAFAILLELQYLCSVQNIKDDKLHPTVTSAAMAEEHLCLCTDILQQQPVEARILLAHVCDVCLFLSYLQ